jgi:hypothetical protein
VVQKQILGLDVAVNDAVSVAVEDGGNDLPKCPSSLLLAHPLVCDEIIWTTKKDLNSTH